MNAARGAEGRPYALFIVQPTRMPAARFAIRDDVPEGMDGTRELERLQPQSRAGRRLIEFQAKKSGLESRQIDIAAFAARLRCGVHGFPANAAVRAANTKAARRRPLQPIDDQTAHGARLSRIDH